MPFLEEVIASDVSYGSGFGGGYAVEVSRTLANRYAVAKHPYKRATYQLRFDNKSLDEQLEKVIDIFDRCGGTAGGCLVRDRANFSTNFYVGVPTAQDQLCVEINAVAKTYQLTQFFGTPSSTCRRRKIKKPVAGTVVLSIKEGEVFTPTVDFTVDVTTGVVTLTNALTEGQELWGGCYFNVPVAFLTDLSGLEWRTRLVNGDYIMSSFIELEEVLNPESID